MGVGIYNLLPRFFLEKPKWVASNCHHCHVKNARLILVEDDPFTRATLGDALALHGFDIRARIGTAFEAIKAQRIHDPQVALLDLDLGVGASGIDVAIALREQNPKIGIVFLTTYKDPRLINSNMPNLPEGAIFLNKLEMNSTAKIAIQISLAIVKPLAKRALPWVRRGPLSSMSAIQIEILKDVAAGLSTSEIARKRGVTEQAIDKSINRISKNLGIPKSADSNLRVQIVRAYFKNKGQGL
jgi:DNA-binding NarL/FixJ family response regulator